MVFSNQDKFVWTSEKSGYRHAYIYDHEGNEKQLTSGSWEITSLIALDDIGGWLYFNSKKDSYIEQHIYRVRTDGTDMQKLSSASGWYSWNIAPGGQFAIEQYSNVHTPPRTVLKNANGTTIRVLEENKLAALDTYNLTHPEFIKVKTTDGVTLNASILKPASFDANKKYPVITYGYGNKVSGHLLHTS